MDVSTLEGGKGETHIYSCMSYKAWLIMQAIFRSCLKHLLLFLCPTFISTQHQTPCQYHYWHPLVQLLIIPQKTSVFLFASGFASPLIQLLPKLCQPKNLPRECLTSSPYWEKLGKRCGNKRISQGGVVHISILKSAPGKFFFKFCLQKVFPEVFPGISWFLTDVKW